MAGALLLEGTAGAQTLHVLLNQELAVKGGYRIDPNAPKRAPERGDPMVLPAGRLRQMPASKGGGTNYVWEVDVEEYLPGVILAEMGGDAPDEALKAQAILARSLAIRALRHPRLADSGCHVDMTVRTQAWRTASAQQAPRMRAAVEATRGLVLLKPGNPLPPDAPYHASCGGFGAAGETAWPGGNVSEALQARPDFEERSPGADADYSSEAAARRWIESEPLDAWCSPPRDGLPSHAGASFRWHRKLTPEQAKAAGVAAWRAEVRARGGHLVVLRTASGKVSGNMAIRGLVSPALRSSVFVWEMRPDGSAFLSGAGHGHGVGMCQVGARGRAAAGQEAKDILEAYYPGLEVGDWRGEESVDEE